MLGTNPRQLARMMKQMGIDTRDIPARRVIVECEGYNLVIENPAVTEINMKGQRSYQISGEVKEEQIIKDEDIRLVMEQANVTREDAIEALKLKKGDIADAILSLTEETDEKE